jgi:hypothetical protein
VQLKKTTPILKDLLKLDRGSTQAESVGGAESFTGSLFVSDPVSKEDDL